jgi:hypothetical protein
LQDRIGCLAAVLVPLATGALAAPSDPTADTSASTDAISLSGDELWQAVSGKTVYLDVTGFELPIHYQPDGRMSGTMGTMASFARSDGAADRGHWWIEANQLCQQWTSWLDGQTYCYTFTLQGGIVDWYRNDGRSGTARIGE